MHSHPTALSLALAASFLVGCGIDGPPRYRVQGLVTYDGKPVPAGTIIFEPDSSQKNDGPQGRATIHGGNFDTSRGGIAIVGGPHRITILGCDGTSISETSPQGKPLFDPYTMIVDLPKKDGKQDFEVPSSKVAKPK